MLQNFSYDSNRLVVANQNGELVQRADFLRSLSVRYVLKAAVARIFPVPQQVAHAAADADLREAVLCIHVVNDFYDAAVIHHLVPEVVQPHSARKPTGRHNHGNKARVQFYGVLHEQVVDVTQHRMHSEYFSVSQQAADAINRAKAEGRRVICVGTTSVRTLESAADANGLLTECSGNTEIFIYPPYKFKVVDCLITNFHLPESTLIMLVSALCSREEILKVYETAVEERYRFFSFGDAMMIL